jgi:hypothetical protein
LAPHLNRERELGPAAASDRFTTVLDKAAVFEQQNQASRDVYWYRLWRASAMIEMGQAAAALELVDGTLREVAVAAAGKTPAQPDRFRMFAFDLQARGLLVLSRHAEALPVLERSYGLAQDVPLETRGDCDRELMLASRGQQLIEVASVADPGRVDGFRSEVERHLDRWSKCLVSRDYPGFRALGSLTKAIGSAPAAVAIVPPPPAAVVAPVVAPPPPPPARVVPPPPLEAGPIGSLASLPSTSDRFAPIDAAPYKAGIDAARPLLQKHDSKISASMAIRTDGRFRALVLSVSKRFATGMDVAPLFESTVVFFEQTRGVEPGVDRVIVETPDHSIVATKADVFDLFVDKIDAASFAGRLRRIR